MHRLWKRGKTCVPDTVITDTNVKTHGQTSLRNVIKLVTQLKKDSYLYTYLELASPSCRFCTRLIG